MFKKNDVYLILVFLVAALLACGWLVSHKEQGVTVRVTIDGELFGDYPLQKDEQITIERDGWKNILAIQDGYADMLDADCPDRICVDHKKIQNVGESIVCLPHKVVIEIISKEEISGEEQIDIITH